MSRLRGEVPSGARRRGVVLLPVDATQLVPAEHRADLVMRFEEPSGRSVGVVVEVQLKPDEVPPILDPAQAHADPELAVLSAMAHGRGPNAQRIGQSALSAGAGLDEERSRLCADLILLSASAAARRFLEAFMNQPYEYQSEFARKYVAKGREEGREEVLRRVLAKRFPDSAPVVLELLPRCEPGDLLWLADQLFDTQSAQVLAIPLRGRLDQRGTH